ncbi:sigma-70 family RNA polymerase sigma factor [Paludicola sp. MB14-C6]|uniref:RNA polymerase sigma factor n=1 Tax=Paludihabitans sp. MB14-C6 TaxID=3070656 RepID=UPI0027DCE3BD|nr:sigma-70 family RNA polymerase sigma factor [Paludicola sp. MB14-C6]WMJ22778.1 sigma-70 family RNA polymerase sigma factor [Paludicola sp. MB14-C6]
MDNNDVEFVLKAHSDMVYKLALSQTKNQANAEDIFQDVFIRLMKTDTKFENNNHIKAWLIKTTLNCCRSLWSSAWFRRTTSLDENLQTEDYINENNLYTKVMELPKKYRVVIHLFYYEDMSISDIAKSTGLKKETIASQLSRGRNILKQKLGKDFIYE